ncbi:hypothetical protein [Clostridium beijerinckii]|uniref:hypothetical protein n=1 Tax=Clostridium beijerinckii TaxID=1520 RepID=UPI00156FEDA9|nr:hypothetical protein [Clostridium beijerinckii]NRT74178.1 hypothetical protein [Clostridium beijerinckii]
MFCKIAKGTELSVLLYGIIERGKANRLPSEKYLAYLFKMLANSEINEIDMLEKCMQWSENTRDELCVKTTK